VKELTRRPEPRGKESVRCCRLGRLHLRESITAATADLIVKPVATIRSLEANFGAPS
jgi:hypothetical protein